MGAAQKQTLGEGVPELVDVAVNTHLLEQPGESLAPGGGTILSV
jgi:hypothetical protein